MLGFLLCSCLCLCFRLLGCRLLLFSQLRLLHLLWLLSGSNCLNSLLLGLFLNRLLGGLFLSNLLNTIALCACLCNQCCNQVITFRKCNHLLVLLGPSTLLLLTIFLLRLLGCLLRHHEVGFVVTLSEQPRHLPFHHFLVQSFLLHHLPECHRCTSLRVTPGFALRLALACKSARWLSACIRLLLASLAQHTCRHWLVGALGKQSSVHLQTITLTFNCLHKWHLHLCLQASHSFLHVESKLHGKSLHDKL